MARGFEDLPLGEDAGAAEWFVLMPGDSSCGLEAVVPVRIGLVGYRANGVRDHGGVMALVHSLMFVPCGDGVDLGLLSAPPGLFSAPPG